MQPGVSFYIISYFTPFSLLRRNVITTDVSVVVAGVHLSLDDGTSHWDFVGVGRSVWHRPLAQSSKIRWVCAVRINQRNGVMVAVQFVVDFIVGDDLASVYIVVHFRLGQEFPGLEVEDEDALSGSGLASARRTYTRSL